jgi:hypothetical protein
VNLLLDMLHIGTGLRARWRDERKEAAFEVSPDATNVVARAIIRVTAAGSAERNQNDAFGQQRFLT